MPSRLRFSLSHSGDVVAYAFARDREVGIDVERMRPDRPFLRIAERFFAPGEVAVLRKLPESLREEGFYNGWTRKEAYVKARGGSVFRMLKRFEVSLAPGEPARLLGHEGEPEAPERWDLEELAVEHGYKAALAVEGGGGKLRCAEWSA
jgi:4'-phosphopantetheinyl transferase